MQTSNANYTPRIAPAPAPVAGPSTASSAVAGHPAEVIDLSEESDELSDGDGALDTLEDETLLELIREGDPLPGSLDDHSDNIFSQLWNIHHTSRRTS